MLEGNYNYDSPLFKIRLNVRRAIWGSRMSGRFGIKSMWRMRSGSMSGMYTKNANFQNTGVGRIASPLLCMSNERGGISIRRSSLCSFFFFCLFGIVFFYTGYHSRLSRGGLYTDRCFSVYVLILLLVLLSSLLSSTMCSMNKLHR